MPASKTERLVNLVICLLASRTYVTKERLRSTKMPGVIAFRDDLPYSPTGKLLRRVLRDELSDAGN